MTEVGRYLGV